MLHALRVRDLVSGTTQRRAVDARDQAKRRQLVAALARADRDHRTVVGRLEPVDRDSRVGRRGGRIGEHDRVGGGIEGRPAREEELLALGRALVREQVFAATLRALDERQLHQRNEALVPAGAVRTVEVSGRQRVLRVDPLANLWRVAGLEPTVGVGNRGAVIRRRRRPHAEMAGRAATTSMMGRAVSRDPCWGACRGLPSNGACAPWPSWFAST